MAFEGPDAGQYSPNSIRKIFRQAVTSAGIESFCTVHTLPHSFATPLLEPAIDLSYIQELLGHCISETTQIYTHINQKASENLSSPLDFLEINNDLQEK